VRATPAGGGVPAAEAGVGDPPGLARFADAGDQRMVPADASSMVTLKAGARLGPQDAHRPVLVATHDRFDTVAVDLRQLPALQRLAIIAFSHSRRPLRWGGTLLVTTLGGAKVAVPIEPPGTGQVAVLLTAYNVAGEIVLRREMTPVEGSVRDACRAFGFTRISWLDDRTPVD